MSVLVRPYRFGTAGPVTPSIGTITALEEDDAGNVATHTFSHTSSTGHVVVIGAARNNGGVLRVFTGVTWNGNAMTIIDTESFAPAAAGRACTGMAYIKSSSVGTFNIVITWTSAGVRDFAGFALDLDSMAASTIGGHGIISTNTSQSAQAVSLTASSATSLLVGAVFAQDGTVDPMTVSVGWTEQLEAQSGNGANDVVGVLASRTSGSTGSITLTGTGSLSTDDWSGVVAEFLPV